MKKYRIFSILANLNNSMSILNVNSFYIRCINSAIVKNIHKHSAVVSDTSGMIYLSTCP